MAIAPLHQSRVMFLFLILFISVIPSSAVDLTASSGDTFVSTANFAMILGFDEQFMSVPSISDDFMLVPTSLIRQSNASNRYCSSPCSVVRLLREESDRCPSSEVTVTTNAGRLTPEKTNFVNITNGRYTAGTSTKYQSVISTGVLVCIVLTCLHSSLFDQPMDANPNSLEEVIENEDDLVLHFYPPFVHEVARSGVRTPVPVPLQLPEPVVFMPPQEEEAEFEECPNIRLLIVGDTGTGRTTFARRNLEITWEGINEFSIFTLHSLKFRTNSGPIIVTCYDFNGSMQPPLSIIESFGECALIMFDVTSPQSLANCRRLYKRLTRARPNIKIVMCGNKIDLVNQRTVTSEAVARFNRGLQMPYFEVSALGNYNYEGPDLEFAVAPQLSPSEVMIDMEAQELTEVAYRNEVLRLANA